MWHATLVKNDECWSFGLAVFLRDLATGELNERLNSLGTTVCQFAKSLGARSRTQNQDLPEKYSHDLVSRDAGLWQITCVVREPSYGHLVRVFTEDPAHRVLLGCVGWKPV